MKSLRKLPDRVALKFMDMMTRYMSDPTANGLNLETVEGSKDSSIKSLRVDQGYRAIAFEVGRDIMFVHVNEHDKAYRWAAGRRVKLDPETNRIRVIEELDAVVEAVAAPALSDLRLFEAVADARLRGLGVPEEELPAVRQISTIEALESAEERFDPLTYQILYAVAAGYEDDEITTLTGIGGDTEAEPQAPAGELTDTLRGYVSLMRGVAPELVGCRSEAEELDGLVAWVRALPADQIKLSDIGALCARRADADRVQEALRASGIETVMLQSGADNRSIPGVRITTMHRAKGLEFFAVAIPFLSDTAFPPTGALRAAVDSADREDIVTLYRSLLHVAATRAKKALRVSWAGKPTKILNL